MLEVKQAFIHVKKPCISGAFLLAVSLSWFWAECLNGRPNKSKEDTSQRLKYSNSQLSELHNSVILLSFKKHIF